MDADESRTALTVDELLALDRAGKIDELRRLFRESRVDRAGWIAFLRRSRARYVRRQRSKRMKDRRPDMPAFTREDWRIALEAFDHRCAYCGSAGPLEREHFIPLGPGWNRHGYHTADNIVPACAACNGRKGSHRPMWWHPKTEAICGGFDGYRRVVEFLYSRFLALSRDQKVRCGIRGLRESMMRWERKRRRAAQPDPGHTMGPGPAQVGANEI
jgi:5-methylcytosine-specific restriction endonuclease McrA